MAPVDCNANEMRIHGVNWQPKSPEQKLTPHNMEPAEGGGDCGWMWLNIPLILIRRRSCFAPSWLHLQAD